ncbi:hypothetical protein [Spirosoma sp. KUDC1026]|uniref:hypothetical protein n=1 Tax=Spirosoma sp. KUDC1026 TaxID=2745947 RepID=UPI00159B8A42|nr:hypothetical protein [Spirosoma sp. KUDC1026]QKZ14269.1 hypothetical protein HU175_17205 [Spirosoma sp. KUDC1026]
MRSHTLPYYQLFCLLSALLLLGACQSDGSTLPDDGADYFPLETGRYVIYNVTEERFLPNSSPAQQTTYQLKEVTGPVYTDVTGQPAYRLLRYRRSTGTQVWTADSIWSVRRVMNEMIRAENGLDFVALAFPISNRLRWNGNRYNQLAEDPYELRNSGQPYRVSSQQFDATVTALMQDDSTLLSRGKRLAVYARQVGLIYRERTQLTYCSSSACIGKAQIAYGTRQIYRIQQYGRE